MPAAATPAVFASCALMLLGAAGCDGRRRDKPAASSEDAAVAARPARAAKPVEPDCPRAIMNVRGLLTIELARVPGAMGPLERGLQISEASCRDDAWPEPLRRCLAEVPLVGAGGGAAGLWRCAEHVPPSLRAKLEPELRALAP